MQYESITTGPALAELCRRLADEPRIGFDTEFVSEDRYYPDLCLIQVATASELAVIDPVAVGDVGPFWRILAEGDHVTVAHAAREEVLFSIRAVGRQPARLFDIQLASGLVSLEYPAGYGALIARLTGERPPKGETRTDWRRRPLTRQQIQYALSDVEHLLKAHEILCEKLQSFGRTTWMEEEMAAWQASVDDSQSRQRWRRVSGIANLSRRSLSIVRELWLWREEEAQRRDRPSRRILRDDLLVELAKRQLADPQRMMAIRGLDHSGLKRHIPELAACITRAMQSTEDKIPRSPQTTAPPQLNLLGQFLTTALMSHCRGAQAAPSLVGTATDVRELIAYRLGFTEDDTPPRLELGWRRELIGHVLDELLEGKASIRIEDPHSDHPLAFDCQA